MIDIVGQRLRAQCLVGEQPASAIEVVRRFGAVQAQDYAGACWALGQRMAAATRADIDRLCDEGTILRTHVMRPTWHFVLSEDIRWMLDLTGQRVRRAGQFRRVGIGEEDEERAVEVMCAALVGGRNLTRPELGAALRAAGIATEGLHLLHLVMAAELRGAIISGPRRGRQFTYALLAERAPDARRLDRDQALAELTRRYFRGHGPARTIDFAWWSGLTLSDARHGLTLAAVDLERVTVGGKEYWCDADLEADGKIAPVAHLLPNWDEFTVGYRDREVIIPPEQQFDPAHFPYGVLSNVVIIAGRVRGTWRWNVRPDSARVEVRALGSLDHAEVMAIEVAARRLGEFLATPVELQWEGK